MRNLIFHSAFLLASFFCIGAQDSFSQNVTISGQSPVAPGSQETYTANFNYNVDPYSIIYWSVSGGNIISQNVNPANPPIYCIVQWNSTPGTGSISIYEDLNSGEAQRNIDIICGQADGGPNRTICIGSSVVIGIPGLPGYNYSWSPATGLNNPNIAQPTASPSVTTTYTVTMSGNNCISTHTSLTVTVNPLPTISPSGPITKCVQYETGPWLTLTTNLSSNIQWLENGNAITGGTSPTIVLNNNPSNGANWPNCSANITVLNSQTGCISAPVQVTRKNFKSPQLYFSEAPYNTPLEYCASNTGFIQQAPSDIPGVTYRWNVTDPNGNPASGISITPNNTSSPTASITFTGYAYNTATIEARAVDNGCDGATDNDWHQIYTVTIDNSCKVYTANSTQEDLNNSILVFPNPAKHQVTVKSDKVISVIEIFDLAQNYLHIRKIINNKKSETIDINSLKNGQYLIKVLSGKKMHVLKLYVMH